MTSEQVQRPRTAAQRRNPYGGTTSAVVARMPGPTRNFLVEVGGMLALLGRVLVVTAKHPAEILRPTLDYSYVTLRRCWFPVTVALGGFIVFLSVAALVFFDQLGAVGIYPPVIMRVCIESFTVWAVALVLAGIVGASLTSELGARRVRDELDALYVIGVDPVRELVAPRVLTAIALTTLMSFPAVALSLLTTQLAGAYYASESSAEFYHYVFDNLAPMEMFLAALNCLIAGVIIGTVCAYKGMNAGGGSEGLGKAVNQAVVVSFVALWMTQTLYTGITQGIFDLGRFR
ncbi:ABC transporter permease [Actinomycetospora endophytica]|uniref:ABC transporter permease n=1 Tax=Actinomycetospora endophytica TaxID=2291215 RepID=A0ABS8PMR0_9PSEU|nr:ABC transporter permease [Actinomycetospora endophytica]MCD2198249.1 ABC transporter permease [Actinomycetospora endophytica]